MAVGVSKVKITFRLGPRTLTLDYQRVPFSAWGELKRAVGFTQSTIFEALKDQDAEAVVALVWLERKQRERKLRFNEVYREFESGEYDDVDGLELLKLVIDGRVVIDETEGDADEPEDPTAAS